MPNTFPLLEVATIGWQCCRRGQMHRHIFLYVASHELRALLEVANKDGQCIVEYAKNESEHITGHGSLRTAEHMTQQIVSTRIQDMAQLKDGATNLLSRRSVGGKLYTLEVLIFLFVYMANDYSNQWQAVNVR